MGGASDSWLFWRTWSRHLQDRDRVGRGGKRSKQARQQIQHGSAIRVPCVVARGAISKLHEATNYAPIRFGKERLKCVDSKANHIKAESARSLSGLN